MQHLDHNPGITVGPDAMYRARGAHAQAHASWRLHSTPDPDPEPPAPNPNPDDVPPPAHAPVQEPPGTTEPPIKTAGPALSR